jgi:succinylglutamate desuccinylase
MKSSIHLAALAAFAFAASAHAATQQTLETSGFTVKIVQQCEEGNVTCDDVRYTGTSKKTGKAIKLRGKTMHSMAADGRVNYTVFADGRLVVTEGKKTLVNQRGKWTY